MKIKKKRNKLGWFIAFVLLLIVGWVSFMFIGPKKQENSHDQAQSVQRTDQEEGYITSNSSKEAVKSSENIVKDTGEASATKLNSKEGGNKFTDLSSGSFKIYKANNVEVLKTATSIDAPAFTLQEVMQQYPEALIMNASGFNMSTMHITGFQMNNGKLFKDWGSDKRANNAFVINNDGSSQIYDSSVPASTIIENGGKMSFSFGSVLIRDGQIQKNDGSVNWMIHSFIANDAQNNLYLIISDTSTGYDQIMDKFKELDLKNAVVMDGGGSSQMAFKGEVVYPSQDQRSVNDFIILK
ncbi:phosphodiester glycosidase family protein [Lactococcus petauri]|uniref:phosphodiester glycosidase family protein n=1 Tax=Lactococcus petauri TaxID=1940789 RepID=UPI0022DFC7DC|nr:phosphodiester glycosidase family protein [Lactococcus petauri]